jgi:hypothetical protein
MIARPQKRSRTHDSSYSHGEIEQARRASRSPTRSSLSLYSDGGFEPPYEVPSSPESQYIYDKEAEHEIADTYGDLGAAEDEEAEFGVAYHEDGSAAAYDEEGMHQIAHEDSDFAEAIALGSDGIQDSKERLSTARELIEEASTLLEERPGKTERIDEDEDNDDAPHPRTV